MLKSNLNLTIKNVGTNNPQLHDTKGMGYAPDGTGAVGSGDYVDSSELVRALHADWDAIGAKLFYKNSMFLDMLGIENSVIAKSIGLPNFAYGQRVDIQWEAPAIAYDMANACEIPVQEVGEAQTSIQMNATIGGGIGIKCGCGKLNVCGNGFDHKYDREHFKSKLNEIVANAMLKLDAKIAEHLKQKVTKTVTGTYVNRYTQIVNAIAQLTTILGTGDQTSNDISKWPLDINQFRFAIIATPATIADLSLTPNFNILNSFNPDVNKGYGKVTNLGIKGYINGIPVYERIGMTTEEEGFAIVPLDGVVYALACSEIAVTPNAVYDATNKVIQTSQEKFGYKITYGIADVDFMFADKLVGIKGKALAPAPMGAIATYQTTAPAPVAAAPVVEAKVKKAKA